MDDQIAASRELVRSVLAACRPEEVLLVDANFASRPAARGTNLSDGMMGFGVEAAGLLLLPFVVAFVKDLTRSAVGDLAKRWGKELADWLTQKDQEPPLPEHFGTMREVFVGRLAKAGFAEAEANTAGDALVATLVTNPKLLRGVLKAS